MAKYPSSPRQNDPVDSGWTMFANRKAGSGSQQNRTESRGLQVLLRNSFAELSEETEIQFGELELGKSPHEKGVEMQGHG